jgi:hypothetical protein
MKRSVYDVCEAAQRYDAPKSEEERFVAKGEIVMTHVGGQVVAPGAGALMQRPAGQHLGGRYIVQYMVCAEKEDFALTIDGVEPLQPRLCTHGAAHGLCVVHITEENDDIRLINRGEHPARLLAKEGGVDAFLRCLPID